MLACQDDERVFMEARKPRLCALTRVPCITSMLFFIVEALLDYVLMQNHWDISKQPEAESGDIHVSFIFNNDGDNYTRNIAVLVAPR